MHKVLHNYLLRQNLFYILTVLAAGTALYLMADLFDRLDDFVEAGLGFGVVATYFGAKIPLILSQIMPAVFLVSMVIQLCLMARSRELLALRAGGVALTSLTTFFILYAVLWSFIQLGFSQFIGVYGEQTASQIWSEQVRGNLIEKKELGNVWFREDNKVVEMRVLRPAKGEALDAVVYEMSEDRQSILSIMTARRVDASAGKWVFEDVTMLDPLGFTVEKMSQATLRLDQNPMTFLHIDPNVDPARLPMWTLSKVIERLDASGSNVERLRTSFHMKWSYAFSIVAMALIALALTSFSESVYVNIGSSLVMTFLYYVVFMLGSTMGQKGMLPPWLGAWLGNIVFCLLAGGRLAWIARPATLGGR